MYDRILIRHGPDGPYYNLQCRERGKTLTRYVPGDQAEAVAAHTADYRRFQELVAQYARLIIEQTRAERAVGSKKKRRVRARRSSWPKTRKSST